MATLPQLRGLLLEEAILYLLRASGYRTIGVQHVKDDPTLQVKPRSRADIEVLGRGSPHQIDAIADYMIARPFSNPQRLLVEAKFYSDKIEIDVLRNAVGVLKDVSEFYGTTNLVSVPSKNRYHYQYSLFSASDFTLRSQQYAYAHDIHLFPLAHSAYMQPLLETIKGLTPRHFGATSQQSIRLSPSELRVAIRKQVREPYSEAIYWLLNDVPLAGEALGAFCNQCQRLGAGLMAAVDRQFPVLLIPDPQHNILEREETHIPVRIRRNQGQWFLESVRDSRYRLSFDLPRELFELYAQNGQLSKEAALDLKDERLGMIQAFYTPRDGAEDELTSVRMITFELDHDWLQDMRDQLPRN